MASTALAQLNSAIRNLPNPNLFLDTKITNCTSFCNGGIRPFCFFSSYRDTISVETTCFVDNIEAKENKYNTG